MSAGRQSLVQGPMWTMRNGAAGTPLLAHLLFCALGILRAWHPNSQAPPP